MKVLLGNDDGVDAPGLSALFDAFENKHEIWTSAPSGQCSAQSHAFSLGKTLRVERRGERRVAVSGTPADAVYYGMHRLMSSPPDWVVSGVNAGSNLGTDVHYSGTVAAAMEGVLNGAHGMAVSLHGVERDAGANFMPAAVLASRVVDVISKNVDDLKAICWNLNVPNLPDGHIGVVLAPLCRRHYFTRVKVVELGEGYESVRLGGPHSRFEGPEYADGPRLFEGFATLTPLQVDWTAKTSLEGLSNLSLALSSL